MTSGSDEQGSGLLQADEIYAAQERIGPHIRRTPLQSAGPLWLKREQDQRTGSFKLRGALNKVLALGRTELERGVVCASAGNHGQGVAMAAALRGAACTVVVPAQTPQVKGDAIAEHGAELIVVEGGYGAAEREGLALAGATGAVWVSPYNDREVIAGQATIGLELAKQLQAIDAPRDTPVYVPVSGGGLICGLGLALKARRQGARVIGVQTEAAPYMHAHFHGRVFAVDDELPTLADGLAGPIEAGSVTLDWIAAAADDIELVSEEEIRTAMGWLLERGVQVEPSAAVSLAAALRAGESRARAVVLSGGNVDPSTLEQLRSEGLE